MPDVDFVVSTQLSESARARQVCSMFDVPAVQKATRRWAGSVPLHERAWNVGLIVGPSGAGKSSVMQQLFGAQPDMAWGAPSVVDDFGPKLSIERITSACNAVGFSTIPAWLRPYHVLSNGERFRVDLARRLCELQDPVVVDEFTSVVDRQVAKIGSHAVAKWARREGRQFVGVTCHYDVVDWLQPDWTLEPDTMTFQWRSVQPRPTVECAIGKVDRSQWNRFSPFHYMSADLPGGDYYGLWVKDVPHPVAFLGVALFPHAVAKDIVRNARIVVLPDWQGLGLAFQLADRVASAYSAMGWRFRNYPAHPPFIASHRKSALWKELTTPDENMANSRLRAHNVSTMSEQDAKDRRFGGRPCAVFEYVGPTMSKAEAQHFITTPASKVARAPVHNLGKRKVKVV